MRTALFFICYTTFGSILILMRQFESEGSEGFRIVLGLGIAGLLAVACCLLRDWAKKER